MAMLNYQRVVICTNFAIDLTTGHLEKMLELCQETAFDRRAKFPQIGERSSTPTGLVFTRGCSCITRIKWDSFPFLFSLLHLLHLLRVNWVRSAD